MDITPKKLKHLLFDKCEILLQDLDHYQVCGLPDQVLSDVDEDDGDENKTLYKRMAQIILDRFLDKHNCKKGITEQSTFKAELDLRIKKKRIIINKDLEASLDELQQKVTKGLEDIYYNIDANTCEKVMAITRVDKKPDEKMRSLAIYEEASKAKEHVERVYKQALETGTLAFKQTAEKRRHKLAVKEIKKIQGKLETVERQGMTAYYRLDKGDCLRRGVLRNIMVKKVNELGKQVLERGKERVEEAKEAETEKYEKARVVEDEFESFQDFCSYVFLCTL